MLKNRNTAPKRENTDARLNAGTITFYIPGMVRVNGMAGKYQAVSITGDRCALQCDHCRGKLLMSMIHAENGKDLIDRCIQLKKNGMHGVLISGGCDQYGRLPWDRFIPAIEKVKEKTGLYISVHSGLVNRRTAIDLKTAGVDQALIDVVGDDATYREICHVDFGVSRITDTLEALAEAGLDIVPHIVCGLHFGLIKGESAAIKSLAQFPLRQIVIVSLMKIPGTPGMNFRLPSAEDVARVIAEARVALPNVLISLGCARERGNREMELQAINAGVNRMALPSDEVLEYCRRLGFNMKFQSTCCSVSREF